MPPHSHSSSGPAASRPKSKWLKVTTQANLNQCFSTRTCRPSSGSLRKSTGGRSPRQPAQAGPRWRARASAGSGRQPHRPGPAHSRENQVRAFISDRNEHSGSQENQAHSQQMGSGAQGRAGPSARPHSESAAQTSEKPGLHPSARASPPPGTLTRDPHPHSRHHHRPGPGRPASLRVGSPRPAAGLPKPPTRPRQPFGFRLSPPATHAG